MRITIQLLPFIISALLVYAIPLSQDLAVFEPLLRGLAELPLVAGAVWLVIKLQDRQQETVKRLVDHFSERNREKDEFYRQLVGEHLNTIKELSRKS